MDGAIATLRPPFQIYVSGVFLCIGSTRQDDIRRRRTAIAMMPLIHNEGVLEARHVDFVGPEQPHKFDRAALGAFKNAGNIAPAITRQEAEIEAADTGSRPVENVKAIPTFFYHGEFFRYGTCDGQHGSAIRARHGAWPDDQHRPFGSFERLAKFMTSGGDLAKRTRPSAEMFEGVGKIAARADDADLQSTLAPTLANPGVDQ